MDREIIIVSAFHENSSVSRSEILRRYCVYKNISYQLIYANFSHSLKVRRSYDDIGLRPVNVPEYYKNISIKRIYSNLVFSIRVLRKLSRLHSDSIVYIIAPPNFLLLCSLLNKRNCVIIDIIDIWPEALPLNRLLRLLCNPLFLTYGAIRGRMIKKANFIITESEYFFELLNLKNKKNSKVIRLKKWDNLEVSVNNITDEFSIAYLGNLGQIYDFNTLVSLLTRINDIRPCKLYIIGDGEKRDYLIDLLEINGINYDFYGAIYDEVDKLKILGKCWFGFNGYVENTEVALSYKSIDYLSMGLPLINSTKGDTYDLVAEHRIGVNYSKNTFIQLCSFCENISSAEVLDMKARAKDVYSSYFSRAKYIEEMEDLFTRLR